MILTTSPRGIWIKTCWSWISSTVLPSRNFPGGMERARVKKKQWILAEALFTEHSWFRSKFSSSLKGSWSQTGTLFPAYLLQFLPQFLPPICAIPQEQSLAGSWPPTHTFLQWLLLERHIARIPSPHFMQSALHIRAIFLLHFFPFSFSWFIFCVYV